MTPDKQEFWRLADSASNKRTLYEIPREEYDAYMRALCREWGPKIGLPKNIWDQV